MPPRHDRPDLEAIQGHPPANGRPSQAGGEHPRAMLKDAEIRALNTGGDPQELDQGLDSRSPSGNGVGGPERAVSIRSTRPAREVCELEPSPGASHEASNLAPITHRECVVQCVVFFVDPRYDWIVAHGQGPILSPLCGQVEGYMADLHGRGLAGGC